MASDEMKVLHITNINPQTTEEELVIQLQRTANVLKYIWRRLPNFELEEWVEMDSESSAQAILNYYRGAFTDLSQMKVEATDMKSLKNLVHDILVENKNSKDGSGNVLRVSISQIRLRVTITALHRRFRSYGDVRLIAIVGPRPFDENFTFLEALVQYMDREQAQLAFKELNGKFLYAMEHLGGLLHIELTNLDNLHSCSLNGGLNNPPSYWPQQLNQGAVGMGMGRVQQQGHINRTNHGKVIRPELRSRVLHITRLDTKIDERQLFNLFSLYGNVEGIVMLPRRANNTLNAALLQMESIQAATTAFSFLHGFFIYGYRIDVNGSRKDKIEERGSGIPMFMPSASSRCLVRNPYELLNFGPTNRVRVRVMGFLVEEEIRSFFQNYYLTNIQIQSHHGETVCDVEFEDITRAAEALMIYHGQEINLAASRSHMRITFLQ